MRLHQGHFLIVVTALLAEGLSAQEVQPPEFATDVRSAQRAEELWPPLPRWREGGTPYNPSQSLHPYAMDLTAHRDVPTSGPVDSPPEYSPSRGVIYYYVSSQWPTVVRDLVVGLTADPAYDEIAYVVVPSTSQQNSATAMFQAGGADMSKVRFIIEPGNALWIRDYGPHFIWQGGALAIVDSQYYPTRPLDNFIPTLLGDDYFRVPTYDMGVYYSGGNFQPGPNRSGFVTSLIFLDNPVSDGFDEDLLADLYGQYQGIDTLHIMPQLPFSVDGTGHIDMWFYLVDEDTVIISEFIQGSNSEAIQITNNAASYMDRLGFEVFRTPAWNVGYTHYTYTNAFRVNNRIFVITHGEGNPNYLDEDEESMAVWAAAAGPEVTLVPINCYSIIPASGAIHCIVMQVPRYTNPAPSAHVIWPDGGELLISGTEQTILWEATDTDNVSIPQIDLYYSIDQGQNYTYIATTSDNRAYRWSVPEVNTDQAIIRVIATAADSDQGEGVSAGVFTIVAGAQAHYDFSSGGGVDKFGFGYQTISWNSSVDGIRRAVNSEISASAYDAMAYSDATGGDADGNRYRAPTPSSGRESTHIFEFTIDEAPAVIDDLEIYWEGYADTCAQIELYIWDYVDEQWCDGAGLAGQNYFMDSWAGNRDGYLKGNIRSDFERYIDAAGQLTALLYVERSGNESFHDHMVVTVSSLLCDFDGNMQVDLGDFLVFSDCFGPPDTLPNPTPPTTVESCLDFFDSDFDADVDMDDFLNFQVSFTGGSL